MKYDFFITYHENDEMAGRWIAAVLREERLATLLESWDFLPGDTAEEKLHHTFNTCGGVIIILSDPIIQSGFTPEAVREVLKIASANERIFFIPVLIQPCYAPGNWGSIALMNLVGVKEEEARKQLIDAATGRAGIERKPEPLQPPGKTKDDILKKREQEYNELLAKTIKHNYHMKLNLEQEIERVVEVKNERTGEMEKRKEWVWEGVELETVLRDGNDYILVNPSGMGKTTFLTYAACALLDRSKNYPFVPLFTTCIALNNREGSIATFLSERLNSFYNNPQTYLIDTEWENLCLLMDALDQAKNVDDIVSSLQLHDKYGHYKKAKIILSSRQNTADRVKERFRKIRLKLPGEDEIQHYLGEENHKKLETLIESSRELIAVPVLLEMLKTITERGHISSILVNRSGLYTEFTRILIDRERRKPRFWEHASFIRHFVDCDLEEVLEKIAFFSLADNEILEIDKKKILKYCETVEKKEALLNIGIILEFFEDREQKIVFRHQSFQAYFAARYMYYRGPDLFQMLTEDIRFFYSDVWYEVMRFYVGLEKDPEKAWKITDSIYNKRRFISKVFKKYDLDSALRFIFAFFLLSEAWVKEEKIHECNRHIKNLITTKKGYFNFFVSNANKFNRANSDQRENFISILEFLLRDEYEDVQHTAADVLGKIVTAKDVYILTPLLRDEAKGVRIAAAEALGNIGTADAIPLLEPLLRDYDGESQLVATEALGKIVTEKDIYILAPLLMDKAKYVRSAAAEALGNIGTANAIPLLEPLLKDDDEYVRSVAASALGDIGLLNVIPLLEPLLKDDDEDVRSAAASALGDIGSSNAIPLLKPLLRDDIKDVRSAAAEALGNIGTADAIPLLEPLLKDENEWVRSTAAVALGKILTSKDIAFLEILLKNNKGEFRHAAAEALGNIGTANAIPLLESLLKDENEWVRSTAAEALGNIGTANTIPLLESLLKDENEYVRKIAAEALERVGTADAISLLKLLLKDKSGFVRRSAVNALGRIVTAKDIFILAPLLRDNDKWVRSSAAGALGNIGSSDAIPLLEPLLRDEEEYVRSAAIEAMGNISTPNAIPLLELLLRDETSDVRCAAAKAIERIYKRSTPQLAIDDILPRRIEIEPISYSPRSSHPLHILHISDIHYSQQRHPDIGRIFHEFKEDLTRWRQQRNNEKIQAVCLTGDIAYDGNDTQYDSIQERIKDILSTTGCSKNGLFMVPGNHDVQNYENLSQQSQKNLAAAWDNKTNINFNVLSDFQNYREFHEKFTHYHGFIEKYGYQNSRTETQNGVSKPWYSRTLEDYPVRIIGLNSALFGIKDFHEYGKIRMGTNQFTEAYFQGKTGKPSNGELVLLLTHHPLNWLWETEYEEFSTLLERYSVIHLHGHIHRLKIRNLFSFSGSSYLSVGTGSLYGAKGTEDINTYHILTFDFQKQEIRIWARRWVPELGRWSVYADETRNTFPFPRPRVIAWGNDKR